MLVDRVLQRTESAASRCALRSPPPHSEPGSKQVWLRLGGAQCVDAAARANLDLLWRSLDNLPQGEPDLLGPALDAALDNLKALPDPACRQRLRRAIDDDPQIQGAGV